MPSSLPIMIFPIIDSIVMSQPDTILDIGFGWGKYGLLAREYLAEYGKPKKLDGIEIFEPYVGKIQRAIYDNIFIGDARTMDFGNYDFILLVDVIEHLSRKDGINLLNKIAKHCKAFLVSTPLGFVKQDPVNGNKNEEHLSGWRFEDFDSFYTFNTWHNDLQFGVLAKGEL